MCFQYAKTFLQQDVGMGAKVEAVRQEQGLYRVVQQRNDGQPRADVGGCLFAQYQPVGLMQGLSQCGCGSPRDAACGLSGIVGQKRLLRGGDITSLRCVGKPCVE